MKRRTFLMLAALGACGGLGSLLGCAKPPAPPAASGTAAGGAAVTPVAEKKQVKCPRCGAMNDLVLGPDGQPQPITCWKCGYKWTPKV
jgi:hypothetical protein